MELRKDYFLDRWVIIATERGKRPKQFHSSTEHGMGACFFCPGNEHTTPPEIGRVPEGNSWKLRWFPNKFPAVTGEGNPKIETHDKYFSFGPSFGYHEVIAETPDHTKQLWDLPKGDILTLLKIYKHRIEELQKQPNINYVVVFKNHGGEAGTSLVHSHTQIAAQSKLPNIVKEKSAHCRSHCPYCDILNIEKNSERRCFENESFVAFTPYASRFGMEIWIMPKRHATSITDFTDEELQDWAEIMKQTLEKLKALNAPFNYYLHYTPEGENLHFHMEITPRMAKWAGYEFATEIIINSITPENAAAFYRGESK
ncbi:galactose-1-phosphate uridylyltransferase [Candidatus Woesearchaeota archaeon]|nr:galactose-1-phosphate uridylyltransferase [Candidatus Woesearchaeota archaeon]